MEQLAAPLTAEVSFVAPPPGLAPLVDFRLAPVVDSIGLYTLRDATGSGLRLFVVDPTFYVPEYAPQISAAQLETIGATRPDEVLVLVVALLLDDGPVVNLLAPMIVHTESGAAAQVILEDTTWSVQAPLTAA